MDIRNGECIELLKTIPDKSIDLFICDLPYGETNCKWDTKIDMTDFWKEFKRVRKSKRTACIHFCSTKFGYSLIKSNEGMFKMDMVWKKRNKTGGLQSRHRPMRNHEMVYFFYEQAPKYNRDKYHKRIVAKVKTTKEDGAVYGLVPEDQTLKIKSDGTNQNFSPKLPASVVEETTDVYGETKKNRKARRKKGDSNFEPVNPASVVEEKSDVSKNKDTYNKNGGMAEISKYKGEHQSKCHYEPIQPSSVLEESDSKIYKDTIYGDMKLKKAFGAVYDPAQPGSVVEAEDKRYGEYTQKVGEGFGYTHGSGIQKNKTGNARFPLTFDPPNPGSVVESDTIYSQKGWKVGEGQNSKEFRDGLKAQGLGSYYEPRQPGSVVEEKVLDQVYGKACGGKGFGGKDYKDGLIKKGLTINFEPPNPASVLEEITTDIYGEPSNSQRKKEKEFGNNAFVPPNPASVVEETESIYTKEHLDNNRAGSGTNTKTDIYTKDAIKKYREQNGVGFAPPTPASVLEEDEYIIPAEDEPKSMYESTKVFIGKRNHQTEKPQDILEFFLKYWTDEDDVVLDPTMGSGSTGVACKKLNRKFIGFELDEKIFKVAEKRINK